MNCPFFPMRPMNGGRFDLTSDKGGGWAYEPKMNGWRLLVDGKRDSWNRLGQPSSIASAVAPLLVDLPEDAGVLDCEILERRGTGKGILLVLDCPDVAGSYDDRQKWLEKSFREVPLRKDGKIARGVYRLPVMGEKEARKFWKKWEGNKLIEGVVCKRRDTRYIKQSSSSSVETHYWVKHRWE